MNNFNNIPEELKSLKRWVLWKKKKLDSGKITKYPVCAETGKPAKSNDESTWSNYTEAVENISIFNADGIGFMLGGGYFGIDIDHAINNKNLINEFIDTLKSYVEKSQSGEGIHIICKGKLPKGARRKNNIEMYDSGRFFVMTGDIIENYPIMESTESVKVLYNKYLCEKKPQYIVTQDYIGNKFTQTIELTDEQVIEKIQQSKNAALYNSLSIGQWDGLYPSQSEADSAFATILAFWTNKNTIQMDRLFRKSGLMREKWDRKTGNSTYGEIVIDKAIRICKNTYIATKKIDKINFDSNTGEVIEEKKYDPDDTGNANRFVDKFGGGIRYNTTNKWWMIYDGKTWIRDEKQIIKKKADVLIDEMRKININFDDKKTLEEYCRNLKRVASSGGKEAMIKEAQHIGNIPVLNNEFDVDKFLLNCENGVVDLRTGEIKPHNKDYMLSKNTHINIDMENEPTLWISTVKDIFLGSDEMVDFIQKALGYSLTGSTKEQCFFQCYGDGSNGKTMFFNIVNAVFGDYGINVKVETILTNNNNKSGGAASPDIARMNGARFVKTEEPNENSRMNEGLVKELTGGGAITARYLYAEDFEFKPIFKLWVACNYKLIIRGTDKGTWRRQRVIPFNAVFEGENNDKDREEKLMKELPQILGWCVKGAIRWQKEGLESPKEIEIATKAYREEMDIVETFINDCCNKVKAARTQAGDMYNAYKEWAKNGNEFMMSQKKFGIEFGKKFERKKINGYNCYCGIILKKKDTSYTVTKSDEDDEEK